MSIETIHLSEPKYQNYLRSFTNQNWILCLGAGICRGILPDWFELTLNLANSTFEKKWTKDEFQEITSEVSFSLMFMYPIDYLHFPLITPPLANLYTALRLALLLP